VIKEADEIQFENSHQKTYNTDLAKKFRKTGSMLTAKVIV
jgi:hypothetical protein